MKKKSNYIWPTILAAALSLGVFVGGKLDFNDSPEKLFTTNSKKDKLNRLIDYIDYEYVDEINTDSIVDVTVNNILDKLDPHSVYIPKEEMTQVSESMKGDFVGIGINFYPYRDTISVIRTIKDGPSFLKGIEAGDRILMADKDTLYGRDLPSDVIVEKLKGKEAIINKIKEEQGLSTRLQYVIYVDINKEKSTPYLGFDEKIIEFLYKTNSETDFDIYRVDSAN